MKNIHLFFHRYWSQCVDFFVTCNKETSVKLPHTLTTLKRNALLLLLIQYTGIT